MSQDEQIDIVNERDEVVDISSKFTAHNQGLLHRTVIAEVIGPDGRWTLVQQASDKQDAGQFVSPVGGHVRAGESEDDALRREAAEEYGLTGELQFKCIGKKVYKRQTRGKIENHYFSVYEIYTNKPPVLNEESVGTETFSKEQLARELKENPSKFGDAFHFVFNNFYQSIFR